VMFVRLVVSLCLGKRRVLERTDFPCGNVRCWGQGGMIAVVFFAREFVTMNYFCT
jgi:hypothetical protein